MTAQTKTRKTLWNMVWLPLICAGALQCTTTQAPTTPRSTGQVDDDVKLEASPTGAMIQEGEQVHRYEDCDPIKNIGEVEDGEEQGAQVEFGIEVKIRERGQTDDGKPRPYTRYRCRR